MGKKLTKKEKDARKRARARNAKAGAKTSRGLRVSAIHFEPRLYGKDLPPALAALGIRGDRMPILALPPLPRFGITSLALSGAPEFVKKKAQEHVAKSARIEAQRLKVVELILKAMASGKDTRELSARLTKLQNAGLAAKAFDTAVAAKMAGLTPAQAKKAVRDEVKAEAKRTSASAQQAAAASAPAATVVGGSVQYGPMTAWEEGAHVGRTARQKSEEAAALRAAHAAGAPKDAEDAENRRVAAMMHTNPIAYIRDGAKSRRINWEPASRGTKGAVSVLFEPQIYKFVTLSPAAKAPKVKKNSLYSVRKNMSKRSMKMNPLGADLAQLGKPVLGAGAGFVASRLLNALALMGAEKSGSTFLATSTGKALTRIGATGVGIVATIMYGNKLAIVRDNRTSIVTGMALNALEGSVRQLVELKPGASQYVKDIALGGGYGYDMSHAGAPYSPMMGEYVSQSLNGGFGEYVSQSLNGDMGGYVAQAAAGMGEYVSQSLNGIGEYSEGVDPSDQEGVDGMIDAAEGYAGLGTSVMAATAGLGTSVMAATAGLYGFGEHAAGDAQNEDRGIMTSRGIYNYFTNPQEANGGRLPSVSIEDAPMPVTNMGTAQPGAVPIGENVATPEGRGYAGGIFGRHVFGTMI
jgi:hypothetical protein